MGISAGSLKINFTTNNVEFKAFLRVISFLYAVFFLFFLLVSNSYAGEAERLLSIVDYMGGDYKNAVKDGKVVDEREYKEMVAFSSDVIDLFSELKASGGDKAGIEVDLIRLKKKIEDKSQEKDIELIAKGIRDKIISAYNVVPYPQNPPSFQVGKRLYEKACAECHGVIGAGNGPSASGLGSPPMNFTNGGDIGGLSPFKVFNAVSFGIANTDMPEFPTLSEDDKWNIAFYVFSLRFNQKESEEGEKIFKTFNIPHEMKDPKVLATLSDDELSDKLRPYLKNEKDLPKELAFLRRGVVRNEREDPLAATSSILKEVIALYERGNKKGAYDKALDTYLNDFEKVEPMIISRDQKFGLALEAKFVKLRGLIKDERPIGEIKTLHGEIESDLKLASILLRSNEPIGKALTFINSFAILIREGLEAALIVAAVLAFLGATGAKGAVKYVHLGWILALVAGLFTWFLAQSVISISGAQRETIEGVTSLFAAAVLFYVSYWLITKIEVKKWKEYIQGKVKRALSKESVFALASVSFFAVYREAFESVLFYQALWLQADNSKGAVIWGLVAGTVLLTGLVLVIFKLGLRIPLKYFFSITSFMLYFLSFVLAGKGVRGLQEAGIVGITPLDFIPQADILGIFPTLETTIVQGVLLLALIGALIWLGFINQERERKTIVTRVSHIANDMKTMHEAFEHVKGHIIEWRRCEEINIEAEELEGQIQDVLKHVDELENRLEDFFDMVLKNRESTKEPQTVSKEAFESSNQRKPS
jgi:high-affinity iron transporter